MAGALFFFDWMRRGLYLVWAAWVLLVNSRAKQSIVTGPPSSRTRCRLSAAHVEQDFNLAKAKAQDLRAARNRVRAFAMALLRLIWGLPWSNGCAIRKIRKVRMYPPALLWENHASTTGRIENNVLLLPRLKKARADDAIIECFDFVKYASLYQRRRRRLGKTVADWQKMGSGGVTLAHIDVDQSGANAALQTYFVVVQGKQLIIAWDRKEKHEDYVMDSNADLSALYRLKTLTLLLASAGDVVHMPTEAVHIVITLSTKVHLSFHMYD